MDLSAGLNFFRFPELFAVQKNICRRNLIEYNLLCGIIQGFNRLMVVLALSRGIDFYLQITEE